MSAPFVLLLSLLFAGVGYHRAYDTKVLEVDVPLAADCAPFAHLRVVQLSDLHVTSLTPKAWLEEVVAKTNALEPDMICITGDIADLDLPDLQGYMAPLRQLRARYGVYYVDGNHEYYKGQIFLWRRFVKDLGFVELHN
ncbi:MAG: metallophosphoesterase, partial [Akkermansia sp.]